MQLHLKSMQLNEEEKGSSARMDIDFSKRCRLYLALYSGFNYSSQAFSNYLVIKNINKEGGEKAN